MSEWIPGYMPETITGLEKHIVFQGREVQCIFIFLYLAGSTYSIDVEGKNGGKEGGRELIQDHRTRMKLVKSSVLPLSLKKKVLNLE